MRKKQFGYRRICVIRFHVVFALSIKCVVRCVHPLNVQRLEEENHKCCLECEEFECCIGVCDSLDNYEYTEECPDYVKEDEDENN